MASPFQNISCITLSAIDGTDCLGDSRNIINTNIERIGTNLCSLLNNSIVVNDTPTINHTFNTTTRLLTSEVIDNSVTNKKLAFDGGAFGFKNKIINGNFDFWQRSISTTDSIASGNTVWYPAADRWIAWNSQLGSNASSGTYTVSRQSTTTIELQRFLANYYQRFQTNGYTGTNVLNSATAGYDGAIAIQNIENAITVLGKTLTVSFWARSSVSTKIFFETQIHSTQTAMWTPTICKVFDITPTWQKYTFTFVMPTYDQVVAAAYNPNAVDVTQTTPIYAPLGGSLPPIETWLYQVDIKNYWSLGSWRRHGNAYSGTRPAGFEGTQMSLADMQAVNGSVITSGWYDIAQVQLEEGPTATPFEFRPHGTELALCQRYYSKSYRLDVTPGTANQSLDECPQVDTAEPTTRTSHNLKWVYPVTMRRAPDITIYSPTTGAINRLRRSSNTSRDPSVDEPVAAIGRSQYQVNNVTFSSDVGASTNVERGYKFFFAHFTANAEL